MNPDTEAELPPLPNLKWSVAPTYPAIMIPWPWGIQAYWSDESGTFIIQEKPPSALTLANPDSPLIQIGVDGITPSLGRKELGWGWFTAKSANNNRDEIHRQLTENDPADDLEFWLTDLAIPESPASTRSYLLLNTKPQPQDHVRFMQASQVTNKDEYNKVFDSWKVLGYGGAVVQQYQALFEDDHLICDFYVSRHAAHL